MIYLTSDTHYWHTNVIKYCDRPYSSIKEMDLSLIENFNNRVSNQDIVYHLGDFSMNPRASESILPRLNRKEIHLIAGNHDKPFRGCKRWNERYLQHGWNSICHSDVLEYKGYKFKLSHLPFTGDHTFEDRLKDYRPTDDGLTLLHGHRHFKPHEKINKSNRGTITIDCGVDAWNYSPVSIEEIIELYESCR